MLDQPQSPLPDNSRIPVIYEDDDEEEELPDTGKRHLFFKHYSKGLQISYSDKYSARM